MNSFFYLALFVLLSAFIFGINVRKAIRLAALLCTFILHVHLVHS